MWMKWRTSLNSCFQSKFRWDLFLNAHHQRTVTVHVCLFHSQWKARLFWECVFVCASVQKLYCVVWAGAEKIFNVMWAVLGLFFNLMLVVILRRAGCFNWYRCTGFFLENVHNRFNQSVFVRGKFPKQDLDNTKIRVKTACMPSICFGLLSLFIGVRVSCGEADNKSHKHLPLSVTVSNRLRHWLL